MFSHVLGDDTKPDTGEVVDREPRVLRVVHGEHGSIIVLHRHILEPLPKLLQPHLLHNLLHENLDEDTTRRRRVILVHLDHGEHRPRDGIACEEVSKEPGDVAKPVGLVAMDRLVVRRVGLFEVFAPHPVELAEAFADEAIEVGVGPFLRATFNDHVAEFNLLALLYV